MSKLTINNLAKLYQNEVRPERTILDQQIFSLVNRYPDHENLEAVVAKVIFVNRVYRTNLHLSRKGAELRLAKRFVKARKTTDAVVRSVRMLGRFSRKSEPAVSQAHQRLVEVVSRVTQRDEESFCSKYLSFHAPKTVPILDQYAYESAWRLVGHRFERGLFAGTRNRNFRCHAACVLELIDLLGEKGQKRVDLKWLDYVLYSRRDWD